MFDNTLPISENPAKNLFSFGALYRISGAGTNTAGSTSATSKCRLSFSVAAALA